MSNDGSTQIKFDPDGGDVHMEIFVGQAQLGVYEVSQHDETGAYEKVVMKGNNVDNRPDNFPLPIPAKEIDKRFFSWNIVVGAPDDSPGQLYYTRVAFTQDERNLSGSPIEDSGGLNQERILIGFVRLEAT